MRTKNGFARKMNNQIDEFFEITNSQKRYGYILYTILLALPGLVGLIYFTYRPPPYLIIETYIFIFFLIFGFPILCILIIWLKYGKRESKIVVNDDKIEFYWLKHLFLQIRWAEIDTIKMFKEGREAVYYRGKIGPWQYTGYTLQFVGSNLSKMVRLWCFPFNQKNQRLIMSGLQEFCKKLNKEIIINESKREKLKSDEPKCPEFAEFYKIYKFQKTKRKFGKG